MAGGIRCGRSSRSAFHHLRDPPAAARCRRRWTPGGGLRDRACTHAAPRGVTVLYRPNPARGGDRRFRPRQLHDEGPGGHGRGMPGAPPPNIRPLPSQTKVGKTSRPRSVVRRLDALQAVGTSPTAAGMESDMKRIGYLGIIGLSALVVAGGTAQASAPATISGAQLARASEPGDDHGGRGRGKEDAVITGPQGETRHHQRGRHKSEAGHHERGRRTGATTTRSLAGDDEGGSGRLEPGDDKGGSGQLEPGDDKGGQRPARAGRRQGRPAASSSRAMTRATAASSSRAMTRAAAAAAAMGQTADRIDPANMGRRP